MKSLISLFILVFILTGCIPAPVTTPFAVTDELQISILTTPTVPTATFTHSPSYIVTPPFSTPTFISASLPDNLTVAYVMEDELWIWDKGASQLLLQRQNISDPLFSDDGKWLLFRQRHISSDEITPATDELWIVRTDGGELVRLVGSDDLLGITGIGILIDYFDWLPGSQKILFSNEEIIEGPPGSRPLFDLYSVDLTGQTTQLLGPGDAGRFVPSPDGVHIALVTGSKIKIFDLENGKQQTLLDVEPAGVPIDGGPYTQKVDWDPNGQFLITSIPPENIYYPDKYAGEATQIWRLFVNGKVELVNEVQLVAPFTGIVYSPDFQYFVYLSNSCIDGMGKVTVRNLTSAAENTFSCVWELPQWIPDSKHLVYEVDWLWQLGNIFENTNQPLDVLNVPTDPNVRASPPLMWVNNEYFLLVLRSEDTCTLSIATLQGIVTQIASTSSKVCPRGVDFSLPG